MMNNGLKNVIAGFKISFKYLTTDFIGDMLKILPYVLRFIVLFASITIILIRLVTFKSSLLFDILSVISCINILLWIMHSIGKAAIESEKDKDWMSAFSPIKSVADLNKQDEN